MKTYNLLNKLYYGNGNGMTKRAQLELQNQN